MKKLILHKTILGFALAATLVGCSFHKDKGDQVSRNLKSIFLDSSGRILVPTGTAPGYNTVKSLVFQNRCIECHGRRGGVNLETYAAAKSALSEIKQAVLVEQSMPPRNPLTFEESQLIRAWVDAGAPEVDMVLSGPEAIPSPEPTVVPAPTVAPTATPDPTSLGIVRYADVAAAIFTPKCIRCHGDTRMAGGTHLGTYENVMLNLWSLENEALIKLSMPPRNNPLTAEEQTLLRTWITQGAQK